MFKLCIGRRNCRCRCVGEKNTVSKTKMHDFVCALVFVDDKCWGAKTIFLISGYITTKLICYIAVTTAVARVTLRCITCLGGRAVDRAAERFSEHSGHGIDIQPTT